jgi:hypothetical protein
VSTDEIRSLVAATRAVAKAERERDEARAALEQIRKVTTRALNDYADGSDHAPLHGLYSIDTIVSEAKP